MSDNRHPAPARAAIAIEQLRTTGQATFWVYAAVAAFVGCITLILATSPGPAIRPEFLPGMVSIPAAGLAALLAQVIWRQESPARRGYFLSMPISRLSHQLIRNGAGWVWTMIGTAVLYLWALLVIVPAAEFRTASLEPWQWAAPFVAASIAFLFIAAVATVSRYVGGAVVVLYFGGMLLIHTDPGLRLLATGRFSLAAAGSGSTPDPTLERWSAAAPPGEWLVASLLWLGAGVLAVYVASWVHRDL